MSARTRSVSTQRSLHRDWELWADWCDSYGIPAMPARQESLDAFLDDFPGAESTLQNRLRAIRRKHEAAGVRMDVPDEPATSVQVVVHTGQNGYASVEQALSQLPHARFWDGNHRGGPGLRGRRDAYLLVLLAVVRLTRRGAQLLTEDRIVTDPLRIAGVEIPKATDSKSCPRCAVTRWLRVVEPAILGRTSTLTEMLDPRVALSDEHDCELPLDDSWRATTPLLPAIDRHNWVVNSTDMVLSRRSITAIGHRMQWFTGISEAPYVERVATGRFANATGEELAAAQDKMNDDIDAVNERILAILAEMETTDLITDVRRELDTYDAVLATRDSEPEAVSDPVASPSPRGELITASFEDDSGQDDDDDEPAA